jgi:predicted nucleotidyltransferase
MIKINLNIDKLVDEITLNLTQIEAVEAIVVYGSVASKIHDEYSDIDLIVYIGEQKDFEKAIKTIRYEITKPIWELEKNIMMEYEIDDKLVLYTQENLIKLEIKIKSIALSINDIIYVAESNANFPQEAIVFDRNGGLSQIYKYYWEQLNNPERLHKQFEREIHNFLYYYEGFLQKLVKHDDYHAFFNYTIAYHKLATLIAIAEGEYYNHYQPKNFLSKVIKDFDVKSKFATSSVSLNRTEMLEAKEDLLELFHETVKKGIEQFDLELDESQIITFIGALGKKYSSLKN